MDGSGAASSAVLLTVVAVGAAAGVAVRPDSEYVPPLAVVHRDPPGPAQIELAEAAPSAVEQAPVPAPPQEFALFGVDVGRAISDPCGDGTTADVFTPEDVVCELMSQAVNQISEVGSDFAPLLLGGAWKVR